MQEKEFILLKIISNNGSFLPLFQRGYTPSQIAMLVEEQVEAGTVKSSVDGLSLTPEGLELLEQYRKKRNLAGPNDWIMPQTCYYRDPLDLNRIVLPRKKI